MLLAPNEEKMWEEQPIKYNISKLDEMYSDVKIDTDYLKAKRRILNERGSQKLLGFLEALKDRNYIDLELFAQVSNFWDVKKQSRLIESILINITTPPIILFEKRLFPYYSDLDQRIRNTHQTGIGRLLLELKKNKYKDLAVEKVIGSLSDGVTNKAYELLPEAFLFHEQNLRREILDRLLADAGIINTWNWIDKHRDIKKFIEEIRENDNTAEAELNKLILYRNKAAHGALIDEILTYQELLKSCNFIDILCNAISELVTYRFIQYQESIGQARDIGEITEWFQKQNAGVAKVEATSLSVGTSLFLVNEEISYCQPATIISIRINNSPVQQVQTTAGMEVGLKFDIDARRGWRLFQI